MNPRILAFLFLMVSGSAMAQDTVTFSLDRMAEPKRGRIGFLNSLFKETPAVAFARDLTPVIWRGGGPLSGDPLDILPTLFEGVGVSRTIQSPNAFFYRKASKLTLTNGEVTRWAMPLLSKSKYPIEYEIVNEPELDDLDTFMEQVWNTNFHIIRSVVPGAIIHGPSLWMLDMKGKKPGTSLSQLLAFIDEAISAGTLPDWINWHFQNGQDIYEGHRLITEAVLDRLARKGAKVKGLCVGESIRPGDERNTSPSVVIDLLCAAEILHIDQIHAAWTSTPVYGQKTSWAPVIDGLLTKDGTAPRGCWWTYRFYAQTKGRRLSCTEGMTGGPRLVSLAFADADARKVRAMVGLRDGQTAPGDGTLQITGLSKMGGLVAGGKVQVRIWDNPQTEGAADLTTPSETLTRPVQDDGITITRNLVPWGAFLVEISPL